MPRPAVRCVSMAHVIWEQEQGSKGNGGQLHCCPAMPASSSDDRFREEEAPSFATELKGAAGELYNAYPTASVRYYPEVIRSWVVLGSSSAAGELSTVPGGPRLGGLIFTRPQ